ncbi:MAG: pitrilysin family protein [Candidatus Eisenbacteria bacterium]
MAGIGIAARIRDLTLANGARLYLLENHADVAVDLVGHFEGGLHLEAPERSGLANLTVGMLDRGTRRRTENQISLALESNGIELEYSLLRECTLVRARCLAEDLPLLIELVGEMLSEPAFPEDQLRLAKEQVLVELRQTAYDTFERATRRAAELLLGSRHPYAREPLGEAEILRSLTRADLEAHRRRAFTAPRFSMAVAGHIDPDAVVGLLEQRLGPLPASSAPADDSAVAGENPAAGQGIRREHVQVPDKEQIDLVLLGPGIARSEPDFEAYGLANFIFGGSFLGRINQRLRDREGLTYDAQSAIVSGLFPGYWLAATSVHPHDLERAIGMIREELTRFVEEGVDDEELEIARDHLAGAFPIRLETNRAVAGIFLDGIRYGRGRDYLAHYTERLQAITREQVNAAARRLIAPDDLVIVSAGTL